MQYEKYQQGDVVMFKVDDEYFKSNIRRSDNIVEYHGKESTHAILEFGEVTGHKHQINMENMVKEAGVSLHMGYNREAGIDAPEGFQVLNAPVILTHEEHNPLELPPGKYIVRRVREFDHIAGRTGYVAD